MNKYVIAILNFFDNEIKQLIIEAEDEFSAAKKAMIEMTSEEYRYEEIESQNSDDFPKDIEAYKYYLINTDIVISIIQIN